jgi:hypothetical protein
MKCSTNTTLNDPLRAVLFLICLTNIKTIACACTRMRSIYGERLMRSQKYMLAPLLSPTAWFMYVNWMIILYMRASSLNVCGLTNSWLCWQISTGVWWKLHHTQTKQSTPGSKLLSSCGIRMHVLLRVAADAATSLAIHINKVDSQPSVKFTLSLVEESDRL